MTMIVAAVSIVVKAGCGGQFEAALREVATPTRIEDGCDVYECYRSLDNPDAYFFYEEWRDAEAHATHTQTAHVAKFFATVPDLVAESKIQIHEVAETRLV